MSRLIQVVTLALLTFGVAAGTGASPAAAGVIDNGAIATCKYAVTATYKGTWTEALLKKIVVQPPTVPKKAGTQSVGWRFIVERSLNRGNTPWVVTYRSAVQRAARSADFTPMRVGVSVPSNTADGQDHIWYHVIIKMFWYGSGGSLQSKTTHLMNDHHLLIQGEEIIDSYCVGLATQYT